MPHAARVNGRRVFGWELVAVGAACSPSSSSDRTAAERFIPPRLAHALIDSRSEAGSRTVTNGSPSSARAFFVDFGTFIAPQITA
jgi:hypothetical protein